MKHAENQEKEFVCNALFVKKTKIKLDKFLEHLGDDRPFRGT
jgi:hypothetical protein